MATTRHGLYGGARQPYGSFGGKSEAEPAYVEIVTKSTVCHLEAPEDAVFAYAGMITKTTICHLAVPELSTLKTLAGDDLVTLDGKRLAALQLVGVESKGRVYLASSEQTKLHRIATKVAELQ